MKPLLDSSSSLRPLLGSVLSLLSPGVPGCGLACALYPLYLLSFRRIPGFVLRGAFGPVSMFIIRCLRTRLGRSWAGPPWIPRSHTRRWMRYCCTVCILIHLVFAGWCARKFSTTDSCCDAPGVVFSDSFPDLNRTAAASGACFT